MNIYMYIKKSILILTLSKWNDIQLFAMDMDDLVTSVLTPQKIYWPGGIEKTATVVQSTVNSPEMMSLNEDSKQGTPIQTQSDELFQQDVPMVINGSQNKTEIISETSKIQSDLVKNGDIVNTPEEKPTGRRQSIPVVEEFRQTPEDTVPLYKSDIDIDATTPEQVKTNPMDEYTTDVLEKRSVTLIPAWPPQKVTPARRSSSSIHTAGITPARRSSSSIHTAGSTLAKRSSTSIDTAGSTLAKRSSSSIHTAGSTLAKRSSSSIDTAGNTPAKRPVTFIRASQKGTLAKRSSTSIHTAGSDSNGKTTSETNTESVPSAKAVMEEGQHGKDQPNKQIVENTPNPVVSNNCQTRMYGVMTILQDPSNTLLLNKEVFVTYTPGEKIEFLGHDQRNSPEVKELAKTYKKLKSSRSSTVTSEGLNPLRTNHGHRNSSTSKPTRTASSTVSMMSLGRDRIHGHRDSVSSEPQPPLEKSASAFVLNKSRDGADQLYATLPRSASIGSKPTRPYTTYATSHSSFQGSSGNRQQESSFGNDDNDDNDDTESVMSGASDMSNTSLMTLSIRSTGAPTSGPARAGRKKRSSQESNTFNMYTTQNCRRSTMSVAQLSVISSPAQRDDFWADQPPRVTDTPGAGLAGPDCDVEDGRGPLNPTAANTKSASGVGGGKEKYFKAFATALGTVTGILGSMMLTTNLVIPTLEELIKAYTNGGGCV